MENSKSQLLSKFDFHPVYMLYRECLSLVIIDNTRQYGK